MKNKDNESVSSSKQSSLIKLPEIFNYDFESIPDKEKKWTGQGADITDYFNYGFTEDTFKSYAQKVKTLFKRMGTSHAVNENFLKSLNQFDEDKDEHNEVLMDNLPITMGGNQFIDHPELVDFAEKMYIFLLEGEKPINILKQEFKYPLAHINKLKDSINVTNETLHDPYHLRKQPPLPSTQKTYQPHPIQQPQHIQSVKPPPPHFSTPHHPQMQGPFAPPPHMIPTYPSQFMQPNEFMYPPMSHPQSAPWMPRIMSPAIPGMMPAPMPFRPPMKADKPVIDKERIREKVKARTTAVEIENNKFAFHTNNPNDKPEKSDKIKGSESYKKMKIEEKLEKKVSTEGNTFTKENQIQAMNIIYEKEIDNERLSKDENIMKYDQNLKKNKQKDKEKDKIGDGNWTASYIKGIINLNVRESDKRDKRAKENLTK